MTLLGQRKGLDVNTSGEGTILTDPLHWTDSEQSPQSDSTSDEGSDPKLEDNPYQEDGKVIV